MFSAAATAAVLVQQAARRNRRQYMIDSGQGMNFQQAAGWLASNAEMPLGLVAATMQLVDALGERIVYIEAIASPLLLVCDERHQVHQPFTGRYHVEI